MSDVTVHDDQMRQLFGDVSVETLRSGLGFLEGPVWIAARSELIFSDIAGDCLYSLNADGQIRPYRQPSHKANGNTLDREGRLLTCEHATSRVVRQETDGSLTVLASHYNGRELNSPNDIIVAADGTIVFTDPNFGRQPGIGVERPDSQDCRAVYALDPATSQVERIADGFGLPNGLCWSNDGHFLYVNDSLSSLIWRFVWEDGRARDGVVLTEVTGEGGGGPDGMKTDRFGNIFCTGPGGLYVYSPAGELLGKIRTPQPIANFTWGGSDLRTIYLCCTDTLCTVRAQHPGPSIAGDHWQSA